MMTIRVRNTEYIVLEGVKIGKHGEIRQLVIDYEEDHNHGSLTITILKDGEESNEPILSMVLLDDKIKEHEGFSA